MVNIENTIKNFVSEYNKKYSQHPIVVFDFVSLDNEGKLMWWTYNIEEVNEGYKKFVLDFIGTGDSKKTLIKTEYDRDTFSYFELGNSALITDVENKTFQFAKQEDPIGIDDNFNNTLPDREVIEAYEKLFKEKFKNGSTIWVSLPHTDNKNRKVYSAIFTLFNYKIDNKQNQLETYRTFRDFIVTYLIELYKAPVEEQRRLVTRAFISLAEKVDDKKVISGNSKLMNSVITKLKRYSKLSHPILLLGPKGTGKSYFAEEIIAKSRNHYAKDNAYFEINCSKLNPETAYRELFGYIKGAFAGANKDKKGPFEIYTSGTILLDEVHWLIPACQVMLNTFLEKKSIVRMGDHTTRHSNTKLILASNLSLEDFRKKINKEFYDRISTLKISLPSLKELGDNEIELFAKTILKRKATSEISFSEEALTKIKAYSYPGNFRELKNCIEVAVELAEQDKVKTITPEYLLFDDETNGSPSSYSSPDINIKTEKKTVDKIIPFPTPSGAKWSELKISFLDEENVSITIKTITKRVNYAEMGFKDKRTSKPNKSWKVLLGFALRCGQLNNYDTKEKGKIEKSIQRLEEALIKYFNIGGDPIPYIEEPEYKGYRTDFIIEDKSHTREYEDSIRKMYQTRYPKEDERKEDNEGDNDNDSANPFNHEDD